MLRRGVQLPVLREFILSQGFSERLVTMQWDKYWSSNKKFLEPRARRYMAITEAGAVTLRFVIEKEEEGDRGGGGGGWW